MAAVGCSNAAKRAFVPPRKRRIDETKVETNRGHVVAAKLFESGNGEKAATFRILWDDGSTTDQSQSSLELSGKLWDPWFQYIEKRGVNARFLKAGGDASHHPVANPSKGHVVDRRSAAAGREPEVIGAGAPVSIGIDDLVVPHHLFDREGCCIVNSTLLVLRIVSKKKKKKLMKRLPLGAKHKCGFKDVSHHIEKLFGVTMAAEPK